ncbi:MAG TPA: acyltransferase [Thermomonas sp.]|nr:acyltransferase [Thermomonas sp.]
MSVMQSTTLDAAWRSGRNNLNLIRLFAAWMVIYGHAWAITGTPGGDVVTWLTQFKFAGGVAVDVFFFISGFLIAASLERNDTRGYLASRALRILPALVACVALSVFVLGPLLTTAPDYWRDPRTWDYLWANGTLWSSRYDLPGVFAALPRQAVNGSLWTLPIEARLYLALLGASLLGLLTPRRYTPLWALALAAAYAFAAWRHPLPEWLSNQAWCAAFFITGTLCWLQRARIQLRPLPLLALLAVAALARGTPWFHLPYFAIVCYGTAWLAFVPTLPRIRQHDLSYGLYLYGWPSAQLVQQFSPGGPLHNTLWATLLAGALAAASWFAIERPALKLKRRFAAKRMEKGSG